MRHSHPVTWAVFILLLICAVLFVSGTAGGLPPMVASHFDAAGQPNAFMTRSGYTRFVLCAAVGFPVVIVGILTAVYANAKQMKLPNRDYWLAPERIARTRTLSGGAWRVVWLADGDSGVFRPLAGVDRPSPTTAPFIRAGLCRRTGHLPLRHRGVDQRAQFLVSPAPVILRASAA